jgi:hypothetical protein
MAFDFKFVFLLKKEDYINELLVTINLFIRFSQINFHQTKIKVYLPN